MSAVFLSILNMSLSASWIVLAVLILRLLLKKAPKWIIVLLWGIVAIRLICPLSIESALSLIPNAEPINPDILVDSTPVVDSNDPVIDGVENPGIIGGGSPVVGDDPVIGDGPVVGEDPVTDTPTVETPANPLQTVISLSSYVWLAGIAGMLAYTGLSYFRVKRRIGMAIRLQDNIYQSENVVSPFVLGLIQPKIYLPFGMDGQDMEYVIAHENAHIRRKDHWWKPIGFLILAIHWFNPLLWLGYVLLCRDIELACDEKVIKELNFQQKADYSQALLNCSVNRRILAACPLAFGEVGIKERVKSVLNYKKPAFWIIAVAIVASIVAAVCFLTNPVKDKIPEQTDPTTATEGTDPTTPTKNTEPTTPSKGETIQVAEPFASVLNNKKIFFFENKGKSVLLSDYYNAIWKLASVDIDGDGSKEIAVMFGAGDGTLILWQHDGDVYGYEFGFRQMYRINKDGTYLWNTDSGNTYGCSSIAFVGTEVESTEIWRVENNGGSFTNYIDNKPVSQEQMNAFAQYRDLEEVEWTVLGSNTTIVGTAEERKEPENPYAIREITDETVSTKGDIKLFNNGQLTLRVPNSWKCFTASGEDDVAYYFRDPVWGEKCQLRVNVTFAHYYSGKELTQEDYLKALSRFYEDVAIESLSKETIRGYACTKLVYSYTEDNTKFIKISYDGLIEGPRLYEFVIKCPAEERENYKNTFSSIVNSVQFLLTDGEISSLPLDEAYAYAEKQYKEEPLNHRYICDLQPETSQIIEIDGKYYQSFVSSSADIRYIWISQAEFPDDRTALWDWYAVGTAQNYSLDLLEKKG